MEQASTIMDHFLKKLCDNEFGDFYQMDNDQEINHDFIDQQVKSYSKLLKSGIIEAALIKDKEN